MGSLVEKVNYAKIQIDRLKDLTNEGVLEDVVDKIEQNYGQGSETGCRLNIIGGIAQRLDGTVITSAELDERVKLVPKIPRGKFFSYWADAEGEILSYTAEWKFFVLSNMEIVAVFSDEEVEKRPALNFMGDKYAVYRLDEGAEQNKIDVFMCCDIPDVYKKIEWGMLLATEDVRNDEDITYENCGKIDGLYLYEDDDERSRDKNTVEAIYTLNYSDGSGTFADHKVQKIRLYAVIQGETGAAKVIYSSGIIEIRP